MEKFIEKSKLELYKEYEKITNSLAFSYSKRFNKLSIYDLKQSGYVRLFTDYNRFVKPKDMALDSQDFKSYRNSFYINSLKYGMLDLINQKEEFRKQNSNDAIVFNIDEDFDYADDNNSLDDTENEITLYQIFNLCVINKVITKLDCENLIEKSKSDKKFSPKELKQLKKIRIFCKKNDITI